IGPARNRYRQAAGARQSACSRLRLLVLPVELRPETPRLNERDDDLGHPSAWPKRAIIPYTCTAPGPASSWPEYSVPCERIHTDRSGESRTLRLSTTSHRMTAAIPPAPRVRADASATSNKKRG